MRPDTKPTESKPLYASSTLIFIVVVSLVNIFLHLGEFFGNAIVVGIIGAVFAFIVYYLSYAYNMLKNHSVEAKDMFYASVWGFLSIFVVFPYQFFLSSACGSLAKDPSSVLYAILYAMFGNAFAVEFFSKFMILYILRGKFVSKASGSYLGFTAGFFYGLAHFFETLRNDRFTFNRTVVAMGFCLLQGHWGSITGAFMAGMTMNNKTSNKTSNTLSPMLYSWVFHGIVTFWLTYFKPSFCGVSETMCEIGTYGFYLIVAIVATIMHIRFMKDVREVQNLSVKRMQPTASARRL
ncbi:hypothetical protein PCE1_003343 [Barthelona sp. PCE]